MALHTTNQLAGLFPCAADEVSDEMLKWLTRTNLVQNWSIAALRGCSNLWGDSSLGEDTLEWILETETDIKDTLHTSISKSLGDRSQAFESKGNRFVP